VVMKEKQMRQAILDGFQLFEVWGRGDLLTYVDICLFTPGNYSTASLTGCLKRMIIDGEIIDNGMLFAVPKESVNAIKQKTAS
jgi:hypothetical protein